MHKTAVVILNWNNKDLLEKFLPKIEKHSASISDIHLIDNASSDDSIVYVKNNYPSINIIKNSQNYGFAKGYNEGLKKIKNKYIVLVNSDVEVSDNWLEPLVSIMEKNNLLGACQPTILSYNNKKEYEYAGAAGGYIDKFGFPFCRGRIFKSLEKYNENYSSSKIFWATGSCIIIRNELFKKLDGFDEIFFAHMEEIDLCWRMQHLGYKVMHCNQSRVYHIGAATLNSKNPKKTYLNFRNNLYMLYKNSNSLIPTLFARLILDGIAALMLILEGKFIHALSIIKAHWTFYLTSHKLFSKRIKILKNSKINNQYIYPKSIIFQHFILMKKRFTDLNWKP